MSDITVKVCEPYGETDSHDLTTTEISVGLTIDVNPWGLIQDALENAGFPEKFGRFLETYFGELNDSDYLDKPKYYWSLVELTEHMLKTAKYIETNQPKPKE